MSENFSEMMLYGFAPEQIFVEIDKEAIIEQMEQPLISTIITSFDDTTLDDAIEDQFMHPQLTLAQKLNDQVFTDTSLPFYVGFYLVVCAVILYLFVVVVTESPVK